MITIQFLAEWAVRSSILIVGGGLLLAALRVRDPAVRLAGWTAMLCASLAIPALVTILPAVPLRMLHRAAGPVGLPAVVYEPGSTPDGAMSGPHAGARKHIAGVSRRFDWAMAALVIYLLIAGGLLLRLLAGLAMSLRLLRSSRATGQATGSIEIRESDHLASPAALGIARCSIVLPNDWRQWNNAKVDAVLAHERSHIRRRDPAVQLLSSIHRALLWFSPLSWFLHLRIVRLAEEVSDDAAVAALRDPASYAEVLLDFMQRGVRSAAWQGVPMARYARLDERIDRILDSTVLSRGLTRWSMAAILVLGSPMAYLAAAARPAQSAPPASGARLQAQILPNQGQDTGVLEQRLNALADDGDALVFRAAALVRKGEYDDARAILEKFLEEKPDDADALLELGVINLMQKRFHDAEEPFRKAYAIDPSNLRGLLGLAEIHFAQNQPEEGVRVIAEAAQEQPQRVDLKKELANAEFRARLFDQAIADYQSILDRSIEVPTEQADIYARIGSAYSALHNDEGAIESMRKATQAAPSNVTYVCTLAQLYENAGRQREAIAAYLDALKLDPDNGVALNNLAYVMTQSGGDLNEALSLAQHARQQLPRANAILDTVGWIYLKMNRTVSAIEIFRELVDKVRDNPTFHYHYAMALAQKGDRVGALEELHAALEYNPKQNEEKEIREMIRRLSL